MNRLVFTRQKLAECLSRNSGSSNYLIAYSGGLDSHVLLHALKIQQQSTPGINLSAVHVNHGLSVTAGEWETHCRTICQQLEVPFRTIKVSAQPARGESPEAAARQARYSALASVLVPKQNLLTAHHLNDQAETILLRLMRGTGTRGLGAIRVVQPFAQGWLLRPLLQFSREELKEYACLHDLQWIEDDSNNDLTFDRNYLRHQVLPLLKYRWPSVERSLARVARYAAETDNLIQVLGHQDQIQAMPGAGNSLCVARLKELSSDRRRNLLRTWVTDQGFPMPSAKVMEQLSTEMLNAAEDRNPLVEWHGSQVRRYRQRIYLMPPLPDSNTEMSIQWEPSMTVDLPLGVCRMRKSMNGGICYHQSLTIRFRKGGESLRPEGRNRTIPLKKLFQERAIPPWLRDFVPILYADDKLVAVAGLSIDACEASTSREEGYVPVWDVPQVYAGGLSIDDGLYK